MVDIPYNMSIPHNEQVKIQARVLIPVVKAMQAELGEERAQEVVRNALDEVARQNGQAVNSLFQGTPVEKIAASLPIAAANALDVELGEPALGFLFSCGGDWAMAEGLSPNLELTRTQTIMQGAPHCDFRYRLSKAPSP